MAISLIIFSPPYTNTLSNKNLSHDKQIKRMELAGISPERIKTFLGKANQLRNYMGSYGKTNNNIGNLKYD